MRYCLVPLTIVSFAAVGMQVEASDSASHTTTIAARIAPVIEVISWPDSLIELPESLVPGVPRIIGPLSLKIRSNTLWIMTIRSSIPDGRMAEYDLSRLAYTDSGAKLSKPVDWGLTSSGPWNQVSGAETSVTGGPATGQAGSQVDLYLKVEATFDDPVLVEDDHEYRMDLSYIVSVTY